MAQLKQQDFSGGMTSLNVSLAPSNTVDLGLNVNFDDEIGSAVTRLGTSTIGVQIVAGNSILGLVQHIDVDTASNNKLFATINASGGATSVIRNVTDASTDVTGLTASKKMRSLTFNGSTLFINGTDTERSYTSAGFITTGGAFDLANMPAGNLCIEFLDRVYVAGVTATLSRLLYSGVSSGTAVSWTVGNGYVDIEPEDAGGPITALGKVPGYILIFKERSLHRWNFSSAFPESLVQIGTPSQESVVMGGGVCAFYSNSNEGAKGFYVTNGGRPVCISQDNNRPIKKWVDAIASGTEANVAGWSTDRYFCWSIGDITVDGETYNNVVLKYNRLSNQWVIRTYPQEFKVFANYLISGVNTTVGGADDGTVYQMDKPGVYVDATTTTTKGFPWKVRQHHNNFSDNHQKTLSGNIVVRGKNLNTSRISAYVDEILNPIEVNAKGFLSKVLKVIGLGKQIKGTTLSIEVAGECNGAPSIVREIEIENITVDKNYV
jgi:hypothetical protein